MADKKRNPNSSYAIDQDLVNEELSGDRYQTERFLQLKKLMAGLKNEVKDNAGKEKEKDLTEEELRKLMDLEVQR